MNRLLCLARKRGETHGARARDHQTTLAGFFPESPAALFWAIGVSLTETA
jgi:hypothetical protein